jgi:AraC family transcriptional regulator of adaptative response / DNA-3-methyladenine glycosylase II
MTLDHDAAYQAMCTHDVRFDGRLFVGVTSTGVYCRPVCRVRVPRRENCRFFGTAPQAEAQGFRPCLRCRPELAPGLSLADSSQALAHQAAAWLADAAVAGDELAMPALAARLGVTDRHLRRIFTQVHGVSPIDHVTTHRLLLATQLPTDPPMPVTEVALASGFASVRRFNAAFAARYRMNPTALRKARDTTREAEGDAVLRLAFRPPYDHAGVIAFFTHRALPGVEAVQGRTLRRTLALRHQGQALAGWVEASLRPDRDEVAVSVAPALLPALGALLPRIRHWLDLDAEPARIDPALRAVGGRRPGVRVPGTLDGFEAAVRIVLGQQVTVAAARTLTARLVARFGTPLATPWPDLNQLFPSAESLAQADADAIGTLGIVRQRTGALQALARAVAEGRLRLDRHAPLEPTLDALRALPGIGEWTAQLIAMRALAWPDAFPASDIGVLNALGTRDVVAVSAAAEAWRPWRAYAVMKLWLALEKP